MSKKIYVMNIHPMPPVEKFIQLSSLENIEFESPLYKKIAEDKLKDNYPLYFERKEDWIFYLLLNFWLEGEEQNYVNVWVINDKDVNIEIKDPKINELYKKYSEFMF